MTPMLQQAMKILQLSTLELKEWVEKEMLENPVLEEVNEDSSTENQDKTSSSESLTATPENQSTPDMDKLWKWQGTAIKPIWSNI